jgi:hypothetical protein
MAPRESAAEAPLREGRDVELPEPGQHLERADGDQDVNDTPHDGPIGPVDAVPGCQASPLALERGVRM